MLPLAEPEAVVCTHKNVHTAFLSHDGLKPDAPDHPLWPLPFSRGVCWSLEKVATAYQIRVSEIRSFQSNAGRRWSCEYRGSQTALR